MKSCIQTLAGAAGGIARRWSAAAACALALCACGGGSSGQNGAPDGSAGSTAPAPAAAAAPAADLSGADSSAALHAHAESALRGKTIAWVPLAMGLPLTEIWTRVMREEAQARGIKLEVRDPNWNTTAALQAVSALIGEKPDLLVVHNPNVQLYAKELKRAEEAGIPVIQVNMVSNYKTAAYIGPDWHEVGRLLADEIIHQCGSGSGSGKSGKVSIVQGEQTSGVSIEQMEGLSAELATDKSIEVVSSQAANWDTTKAHDITATVLQQHPDLCASVGFWSGMEIGAAEAIKSAGKLGQVKVYASGGEGKVDCQNVDNGLLTKVLSYDSPDQAKAVIQVASFILQSGAKPDAFRAANYSTLHWMEKGKYDPALCYDWNNQWRDYADTAGP